jgi:L-ascorbate metabolism protein UlaG (beta-lactamase superfamily)
VIPQGCNYYEGPRSDHFDGERFYNKESGQSFGDHVKWYWEMETVKWPEWIEDPPQLLPVAEVGKGELRATFINQSCVLIQMDKINVLTDPFWSERAGPTSWLGAKRIRAPGVRLQDLPYIDLILISHDHYDHLDLPTLKILIAKHNPTILVGLGVKARLSDLKQARIIELDWWNKYRYSDDLQITFVPARHSSGRELFDGDKTLWGGYVLEGPHGRVLFFGDTGFGGFLEGIRNPFEDFRLAILPIGSYEPYWFMGSEHMNPEAAVHLHKMLNVHTSMGIHFGTVAEHPQQTVDAHETDLAAALQKHNVPASEFLLLGFGEGRNF